MQKSRSRDPIIDCLGLGIVPLDLLFTVPYYPGSGQKIDAGSVIIQGGGPIPNAMVGLARLGLKTSLIAAVGEDLPGRLGVEQLRDERVETRLMIYKKDLSAIAAGFIEADSGQRTIALFRQIRVEPKDVKTSSYPPARVVHLDGRDLEACIKLARWAKKIGAMVSFDIGSMRNDVSPILPLVDHLVVADAFASPFTKCDQAKPAINVLAELCPGEITITQGIKGSLGFDREEYHYQPAYRVTNVDTTGAGDSFHAGYLYGLLKGWPMPERLRFGAATSALKCTKPGARTGAPGLAEVKRFLRGNPPSYA